MSARRSPVTGQASRKAQLAQIHIARGELHMTEDEYRDLMSVKFGGVRSAAQLDAQQRAELLHHFQRLGWKGRVGGSQANSVGVRKTAWSPVLKKLYSQWQQLADAGLVQDRSAKALGAWCKAQTAGQGGQGGTDRLEWLNPAQLHVLIEMTKRWLARAKTAQVADELTQLAREIVNKGKT